MRFKKVRWDQKAVTLIWTTESGTETHEHDLTSKQAPHGDLDDALQALAGDVVNVCEMDLDLDTLRVQSVSLSFSEKTGVRGAVVTALKPVKIASSPVVLNTPHLTESGDNDKGVMPPSMWRRVLTIEDEARAYLDGKRAPNPQLDAFTKGEQTEGAAMLATSSMSIGGGAYEPFDAEKLATSICKKFDRSGRDRAAGKDE